MDSQLQQLRDAVKAVAKARAEGKPIDLSNLPPAIREKIEAQLRKLPPDARNALQHGGLAKVEQAANKAAGRVVPVHHSAQIPKFDGHYNNTIRAGDASHVPWTWLGLVLVIGYLLFRYAV
jgi:hypothetical protein